MDQLEVSRPIGAGVDQLRQLFWDIQRWQQIWNPIEQVEVRYDDGAHQEFVMQVWRDGVVETVRTIRFLEVSGAIGFFSPDPPPMMRWHRGAWLFTAVGRGSVVTARREYALSPRPDEGQAAYAERRATFQASFAARLGMILERFAGHFEGSTGSA